MGALVNAVKKMLDTKDAIKQGTKDAMGAVDTIKHVESGEANKNIIRQQIPEPPDGFEVNADDVARAAGQAPETLERTTDRNFALKHLDQPEDIGALIDQVAEGGEGFMEQRRFKISNAETEISAQRLIDDGEVTHETLFNLPPGATANAEQATAARMLMVESANNIKASAERIVGKQAGDEEVIAFRKMVARHAAIQMHVQGLAAEAGRALQAWSITAQNPQIRAFQVDELMKRSGGKRQAERLARMMLDEDSLTGFNDLVDKAYQPKVSDAVLEVWINGLLSGPTTHAANITGNIIADVFSKAERLTAAGFGAVRTGIVNPTLSKVTGKQIGTDDRVYFGESGSQIMGWLAAYQDGLRTMKESLKSGDSQVDFMQKYEEQDYRAFTAKTFGAEQVPILGRGLDVIGEYYVRIPGRVLQAEDDFFKAMAYRGELQALAYRKAVQSGADDIGDEMARLLANPDTELHEAAMQQARVQTFTNNLGNMGGSQFQALANSNPALKVLTPFVRTPINLTKYAIHRSPLTAFAPTFWQDLAAGGARKDMAMARASMGAAISASVGLWVSDGTITGSGPSDPGLRNVMKAAGWQPNSIKIGDQYVSYNRLDPFGMIMGIHADAADMYRYATTEKQQEDIAMFMAVSVAENLTSKQYMRGISDVLNLINQPSGTKVEQYLGRLAGSAVPSWLNTITRSVDDTQRNARTDEGALESALAHIKKRTPGWSDDLPPFRNVWGEVQNADGILGPNFLSPLYRSKAKADQIGAEFIKHGVGIRQPSCILRKGGEQLDIAKQVPHEKGGEWACDDYRALVGDYRRKAAEQMIKSRKYKNAVGGVDMGSGSKSALLSKAITVATDKAKKDYVKRLDKRKDVDVRGLLKDSKARGQSVFGPLPKHLQDTGGGPTL